MMLHNIFVTLAECFIYVKPGTCATLFWWFMLNIVISKQKSLMEYINDEETTREHRDKETSHL